MSVKLAVCGKSTDDLHGAWLTEGDSDVHVYDQADTIVIGWNQDTAKMRFTPLALVFGKGKEDEPNIYMQLEGSKGQENPEFFTFTGKRLELLAEAMKQFLLRAEQIARHER